MLEAHRCRRPKSGEPGSRGRPAVGLMVETEARHYLSLRISRGNPPALRDLSSKLVVEEQLELPLQHAQPLLTRIIEHIDQFFYSPSAQARTTYRNRHHLAGDH